MQPATLYKRLMNPKQGTQCPHGLYWYAETESENPLHPVGSLSLDCDKCVEPIPSILIFGFPPVNP
jgi:hypothetical protein